MPFALLWTRPSPTRCPRSPPTNSTRLPIERTTSKIISESCNLICEKVLSKLQRGSSKPRGVLNSLSLVEFLLKNGSHKFRKEMEEELFLIKRFRSYIDEDDDEDLANPIKTLAHKITTLLEDREELERQREEANKLRDRIRGFSSEVGPSHKAYDEDPKYGGISSEDFKYDPHSDKGLTKKLGLYSESTEKKVESSQQKSDLNRKLGLGSFEPQNKEVKESKPVEQNPVEDDTDFLGLGVGGQAKPSESNPKTNLNSSNQHTEDLLGFGDSKPKGLAKLLPAPPKKKPLGAQDSNQTQPQAPVDDLNLLGFEVVKPEPAKPIRPTESNANTFVDDLGLFGVTTKTAPVQQTPITASARRDSDDLLGFGQPSNPTPIVHQTQSKSNSSGIDFTDFTNLSVTPNTSNGNTVLLEAEPKQAKIPGKLPAPPKKVQNSNANARNDFLF